MKTGVSDDNWKSDDPLPAGWTVQVKVRSNGKKDKVLGKILFASGLLKLPFSLLGYSIVRLLLVILQSLEYLSSFFFFPAKCFMEVIFWLN